MSEEKRKYREFAIDVGGSHIDNCAAFVTIHLSDYGWDGGSRLIIKYQAEQSYDEDELDKGEKFIPDKEYSIGVDLDELIILRNNLNTAIEIWEKEKFK